MAGAADDSQGIGGQQRRYLFVAYCMGNPNGDSLIGVYKRALRIGLGLARRGHQVVVVCPGRDQYDDRLTAEAAEQLSFVDLPIEVVFDPDPAAKAERYRQLLREIAPDVAVIGEAPLAGSLLEFAKAAVFLRIPVVVTDNAYGPAMARGFVADHGPMADGVLLTGPSSFHMEGAPPHVRQLPPFIHRHQGAAEPLLSEVGLTNHNVVTVLAYETKAERLARALLRALPPPLPEFVFITRDLDGCRARFAELPKERRMCAHVIPPPTEREFFGLLSASRMAVGKLGFMQVTECLALHTPFIGVTYRGCFDQRLIPKAATPFLHVAASIDGDPATLATARRFLALDRGALSAVHDGSLDAVESAVEFLEHLPAAPRTVGEDELTAFGYPRPMLEAALGALHAGAAIRLESWRASRIRRLRDSCVDALVCHYRAGDQTVCSYLWGRRYRTGEQLAADLDAARTGRSGRRVLSSSPEDALLIETDAGEPLLPPLEV